MFLSPSPSKFLFGSSTVSLPPRSRHLAVVRSSGDGGGGGGPRRSWKLPSLDPEVVQERLSSWLLKTQTLLTQAAAPLVNPAQGPRRPAVERQLERTAFKEELFMASELTVDRETPNGYLSVLATLSIEQFARLNGLTGRKIQKIFHSLAPEHVKNDARSMVEYCCFRYLSRDNSIINPRLKELAFQRLLFVTMLAWEQPYCKDGDASLSPDNSFLQRRLVGEEAFVRIAPAVAGLADVSTAHHLFKALSGLEKGISLSSWTTYIAELLKVHRGRESYQSGDIWSNEQILCLGSSPKRPVLKWGANIALPGKLTLTDRALYFEVIGLTGDKKSIRIDLTKPGSRVQKARVGPLGSKLFDSAVSISSDKESEALILEFVDFGGEMRRDVWHAFISEVISLHKFIREYGPADDDPSIHHVYGAHRGEKRAHLRAANGIARLQCLQSIRKLSDDPVKLVQFSYLQNAPYGDIVLQTLAVNFWGGPLISEFKQADYAPAQLLGSSEELSGYGDHISDIDGSIYLSNWMRSSTWSSSLSIAFWKSSHAKQGIVLSKNLVVADLNIIERAALICKEKSRKVEKTQETIDAATLKGIPSNIDLLKELMLPSLNFAKRLDKLRHWEEPHSTLSFLLFVYFIIFRNLLQYIFPMMLMFTAISMLLIKGLKEQGRLGRSFGKVTIRDQLPSNTIQKIIALKDATYELETALQKLNVSLLKLRTIALCGQPEVTMEVALVLISTAIILFVVPFRYVLAVIILDLFTRELEFRREMVRQLMKYLKERWDAVYAAPVAVLPCENDEIKLGNVIKKQIDQKDSETFGENGGAFMT